MRNLHFIRLKLQIFLLGGGIYGLIELFWRGYTHWSMVLTGGAVLLLLLTINRIARALSLPFRCLIGTLVITALELAVGCIVNLILGLKVWDYSGNAFNLLGQICPLYSFYWFLLCFPVFLLCPFFERRFPLTPTDERSILWQNENREPPEVLTL